MRFWMLPCKHLLVSKTSWRQLQDMSWIRLQDVFTVAISRLPRRLKNLFRTSITISTRKTVLLNLVQKLIEVEAYGCFWSFLAIFKQSIISIHFMSNIKEYRCLKNVIHQIDRKERLLLLARFTTKFALVFVLTQENAFS